MKDYWIEPEKKFKEKKINKKKIIIIILTIFIIILAVSGVLVYSKNKDIRDWIDKNILRKEIMQDKATTIELKEEQNENIYAFNRYIGILN